MAGQKREARLRAGRPAIHVPASEEEKKTWITGTSPVMATWLASLLWLAQRHLLNQRTKYVTRRQTGGTGQFAALTLVVEPNEPGKGYEFESRIGGGAVPASYIPGVEKGIESVLSSGVVAGFPVVDVKVQLIDGEYHDIDSCSLLKSPPARASAKRCNGASPC
jgi:elongation factor G-like protein